MLVGSKMEGSDSDFGIAMTYEWVGVFGALPPPLLVVCKIMGSIRFSILFKVACVNSRGKDCRTCA